jgi:tetratricopeptide (TPR) repeat protein
MKSKRKSQASSIPGPPGYRQDIQKADEVIAQTGAEIRPDNWQQLAIEWFAPQEPDRSELARFIAAQPGRLGLAWALDILRLQVFFEAQASRQIVEHHERAFRAYPRCPLVEIWVAPYILRIRGDFWRVRQMCLEATAELPSFAKPHYELGFMSYLLGDFSGALVEFDRAVALVTNTDNDATLAPRIFFNRGIVRFALARDRQAAVADVAEALRRKPDYAQARQALRFLKGTPRWRPW